MGVSLEVGVVCSKKDHINNLEMWPPHSLLFLYDSLYTWESSYKYFKLMFRQYKTT